METLNKEWIVHKGDLQQGYPSILRLNYVSGASLSLNQPFHAKIVRTITVTLHFDSNAADLPTSSANSHAQQEQRLTDSHSDIVNLFGFQLSYC